MTTFHGSAERFFLIFDQPNKSFGIRKGVRRFGVESCPKEFFRHAGEGSPISNISPYSNRLSFLAEGLLSSVANEFDQPRILEGLDDHCRSGEIVVAAMFTRNGNHLRARCDSG